MEHFWLISYFIHILFIAKIPRVELNPLNSLRAQRWPELVHQAMETMQKVCFFNALFSSLEIHRYFFHQRLISISMKLLFNFS